MMAILSHNWLMSWRKKHIFINLSWHGGHGPLLSPFEGLEVPKLYRSSIVWPGLSKTPAPLTANVWSLVLHMGSTMTKGLLWWSGQHHMLSFNSVWIEIAQRSFFFFLVLIVLLHEGERVVLVRNEMISFKVLKLLGPSWPDARLH